jgi:hypothetical protein
MAVKNHLHSSSGVREVVSGTRSNKSTFWYQNLKYVDCGKTLPQIYADFLENGIH